MELFRLITAFGLGAIVAKSIDALWIQPFLEKKKYDQWLRDKRLEAYSDLASNLLSFGLHAEKELGPFDHLGALGSTALLSDDDDFLEKLYSFMAKRELMFRLQDGSKEDGDPERIYYELVEESKNLVCDLRKMVVSGRSRIFKK